MSSKTGDTFQKLSPSLVYKIWGGEIMAALKGLSSNGSSGPLGETWEISVHPDGPSLLGEQKLSEVLNQDKMPYLVKLIDTSDYLSVQVHPGDEFARKHENSLGKTECWIILGSKPGSGIYLGLKDGVTKESFEEALQKGEEMDKFLNFYPVEKGDFYYVPAGSIHAIGEGVFLAEVQQSSGITYRVWDWNRVDDQGKSRELHIDKAMQVIEFDPKKNRAENFKVRKNIFEIGESLLVEHPQFRLRQISLRKGERLEVELIDLKRAKGILNLEGKVTVDDLSLDPYESAVSFDSQKINLYFEEEGSLLLVE